MKSKVIRLLLIINIPFWGLSQNNLEANRYFDRFEYQLASDHYKKMGVNNLNEDDLLKYIYSSYIIGDFNEVVMYTEPLLHNTETEPFFIWAYAQSNAAIGKNKIAIESFKDFKDLVKIDADFIDLRIKSLELISTWNEEEYFSIQNDNNNIKKGDFSGYKSEFGKLRYQEIGIDSSGQILDASKINDAELLLLKPFFLLPLGIKKKIAIQSGFSFSSINSITFVPNSTDVFLSIAQPVHSDTVLNSPHIYTGNYTIEDDLIINLKKWDFSGFEDSSSCTHVTINPKGNLLAFSKKHKNAQYSDIYISKKKMGVWSEPEPIKKINTKWNEMFPLFQQDGTLSFSSNGKIGFGKLDIYIYDFTTGQVTHPKSPINGAMDDFNYFIDTMSHQASLTSNRQGGIGDDDAYTINFKVKETIARRKTQKIKKSDYLKLRQSVYFQFDEIKTVDNLTIDSAILNALSNNRELHVQLDCYSDNRGINQYNKELSTERGQVIKKKLGDLGIKLNKIVLNSHGEFNPPINCVKCDEEQHEKNRVVIISIHETKKKNAI